MAARRSLATLLLLPILCADAWAQLDLQKLWESTSKVEIHLTASYVAARGISYPTLQRFDANGDGVPDLVMQSEDELGHLEDLQIAIMADPVAGPVWYRIDDVKTTLGLGDGASFFGFAQIDGRPRAIFTDEPSDACTECGGIYLFDLNLDPGKRTSDPVLVWSWTDHNGSDPGFAKDTYDKLRGALDLTGDGSDELIIILSVDDWAQLGAAIVQIWGLRR